MSSQIESIHTALTDMVHGNFEGYSALDSQEYVLYIQGRGPFALDAIGVALGHRHNALFIRDADDDMHFFRVSEVTLADNNTQI